MSLSNIGNDFSPNKSFLYNNLEMIIINNIFLLLIKYNAKNISTRLN